MDLQVNKLKENHSWLLGSVSLFKPPSQKSREALDSQQLQIGSHQLTIQPRLKELATKISSSLVSSVGYIILLIVFCMFILMDCTLYQNYLGEFS